MNKDILIMHLCVLKKTKKDVSLHDPIGQDIDYENKNEYLHSKKLCITQKPMLNMWIALLIKGDGLFFTSILFGFRFFGP
ncbi:hypothetical protein C6W24_00925 [Bacillus atrophaeus]|nr:hypothetical protein C6W24_00925 [Bacillus atrophaeus]